MPRARHGTRASELSTCARSGHSTPRPSCARPNARVASSSCTRHRSPRASAPRSSPRSRKRRSTRWKRPSAGSPATTSAHRLRSWRTGAVRMSRASSPRSTRRSMPEPMQYLLPDLGEGMTEAELVQWRVTVGEHVTRDQIVAHVQTDKAEVELPVPASGTIVALGAEVGELVPVGAPLLELVPDAGSAIGGTPVRGHAAATTGSAARSAGSASASGARGPVRAAPSAGPAGAPARGGPVRAAPPVRKLARELGVDLAAVAGTGPGGRVTAADLHAHHRADGRREPLRGVRRAMAHNMAEAWRVVPHISLFDEIDARPLLDAHAAVRAPHGAEITLTAFFVRAAVVALAEWPVLNASYDADTDEAVYHDTCNVGIAVASDDGLVVPVVPDAQDLALVELGEEIARATEAGRAGHLTPEAIRGATFTVTNFGTEGGRFATPIVRPPQVAILGFGAVRVRPVVDGEAVVAAPALPISLSADHRLVDGRAATGFLEAIAARLAAPSELVPG